MANFKRGLNPAAMGQMGPIGGLLGVDLSKEDTLGLIYKLFKMHPNMPQQPTSPPPPPGGGTGGGTPGTDPNTQWSYPGLLNAPYMMTNWYGK